MSRRIVDVVLCVVCVVLLILLALRNLVFVNTPAGARGQGFNAASYVLLFLLGSLALVFGVRAAKAGSD